MCSDSASIIPPSPAGLDAARGRHLDAKRQRGALGVEVAGEHTRTVRAADQAGQLGLVDAAVLLDVEQRSTGAESQNTAFAERRRVEAEMKDAERYLDDLAATAKLLEGATRETKPKPRASRGKKKGER